MVAISPTVKKVSILATGVSDITMNDISLTYQQMCEKAKEIQHKWPKKQGNVFYNPLYDEILIYQKQSEYTNIIDFSNQNNGKKIMSPDDWLAQNLIWLPQLGDLTRIAIQKSNSKLWLHVFELFMKYVHNKTSNNHEWCLHIDTPEKAWLCFIMEKHNNKIWDGNNWVPNNKFDN